MAVTILLVEDEALVGLSFAANLEEAGFSVIGPCTNSKEALSALRREKIAGAFVDMNLGHGQTSEAVAQELRRRRIPFYFLTGYSANRSKIKSDEASRYLSKPIDEERLIAAAKSMVSLSAPEDCR